jgi:myo-inositol-1(or 4)-monophosphatase
MEIEMIDHLRRLAEEATAQAAEALRTGFAKLRKVNSAVGRDIKTVADGRAEAILLSALEPSGYAILSEERGATSKNCLEGSCWILDPLDGTLNYTRGFPICAVSIAFWDEGRPQFGVIHDIASGECYSGVVGRGASCNGTPLQVSKVSDIGQAVLATGFPTGRSFDTQSLAAFISSIQRYKKIRLIGSAALSLAHVASGRFEAYKEEDIWLWDVAAGLALVEASGGQVRYSPIKPDWKLDVIAWNGNLRLESI